MQRIIDHLISVGIEPEVVDLISVNSKIIKFKGSDGRPRRIDTNNNSLSFSYNIANSKWLQYNTVTSPTDRALEYMMDAFLVNIELFKINIADAPDEVPGIILPRITSSDDKSRTRIAIDKAFKAEVDCYKSYFFDNESWSVHTNRSSITDDLVIDTRISVPDSYGSSSRYEMLYNPLTCDLYFSRLVSNNQIFLHDTISANKSGCHKLSLTPYDKYLIKAISNSVIGSLSD